MKNRYSMGKEPNKSPRRVVVTGWGIISPLGANSTETFSRMSEGKSGIREIESFDPTGLPCTIAGEIRDFSIPDLPETDDDPQKLNFRGNLLMYAAVLEAAEMAGLKGIENRDGIGICVGAQGEMTSVDTLTAMSRYFIPGKGWDLDALLADPGLYYLNHFRRNPATVCSMVSSFFDCRGACFSVASACAASAQAIGEAFRAVRRGVCEVIVAGGTEAPVNLVTLAGFLRLKTMAERYSSPDQACRPFDAKRSGMVASEGAGAVILESEEHAKKRNARILGEIAGYGTSADAFRITDSHPEGMGARIAMALALKDAGLTPADVEYINAHGTGTVKNDLAETRAIRSVFGHRAGFIPVSSNKSMLGHSIAASGAIELVLTLIGMNRGIILPTINRDFPDPGCDLWVVPHEAIGRPHNVALSNSFGFGGQNACLCVRGQEVL